MARNLYDDLRRNSLRALGYADGGDVTDGFGSDFGINVVDPAGKPIRLPVPHVQPPKPVAPKPWQDPTAPLGQRIAQAAPSFGRQVWQEGVVNPARQVASGFLGASAETNRQLANVAGMANQAANSVGNATGLPPGGMFQDLSDWARGQQQAQQQSAAQLAGGRNDLASQIYRGGTQGLAQLPGYTLAEETAGPILGMAAMGGITEADKGWQQALQAAAEGGLTGVALEVMGPASAPLRLTGGAAMSYAKDRLKGVDNETAISNAFTTGALSDLDPLHFHKIFSANPQNVPPAGSATGYGYAHGGSVGDTGLADSPYVQGMRRRTLEALRYADGGVITLDPDAMYREFAQHQPVPPKATAQPPYKFHDPIFAPATERMVGGWQKLWQPSDTTADNPNWWDEKAQAASDVIRGAGTLLAPAALPAAIAAPIPMLTGLAAGMAAGTGTEQLAQKMNVPPGRAALLGDIAGGVAGEVGPHVAPDVAAAAFKAPATLQEYINRLNYAGGDPERGSISQKPTDAAITTRASLGPGALSPAEIAAAKSRQIQELIRRPSEPVTEPGEAAPQPVRDVLARSVEDLERRIPNSQRVVSSDPTKLINGQPFTSLDMNASSEGYLPFMHLGSEEANHLNIRMWEDAIRESELPGGSAAMEAVRKTGARPPTAEFLHRAMSQPQRGRYWYELSGNSFTGDHIDIPRELQPGFIDNVAATSGGAKPYTNMKRAIGSYAENLQNVPIYTDLRDPASVRNALNPELERLGTHKYQNFSGTMQYTSGLDPRPPLSVNDVQQADIFGIKGSDIAKNPALYEVLSRYTNKVRDAQNALLPEGAQPWETWQVQAPTWVRQRLDKDPTSTYDDYAMVLPRIIQELNDAGVPTPNGKITMDTLMDPRTPNVMSGTREHFMGTPTGTVEFATNKTPAGATAAQTRAQLEQQDPNLPWVREAKADYEKIQRNAMKDFAMRHGDDPSLVSQLMSEITGQKLDVSRLEWNGYGTYEGDINPNLRIPMGGAGSKGFVALTKPQREAFLSILGEDLNQDGMAASHFTSMPEEQLSSLPANKRTYSVFMRRYDNQVDPRAVQEFSRQVGYPVNVSRTANGILVDVNVADKAAGPTREAVENAANATFGNDSNVHDMTAFGRAYDGDFVHNSNYRKKINAQIKMDQPRRGGPAGNPPADLSNIERIRQEIRRIAQNQDAEFAGWTQDAQTGKQYIRQRTQRRAAARAATLEPEPAQ